MHTSPTGTTLRKQAAIAVFQELNDMFGPFEMKRAP